MTYAQLFIRKARELMPHQIDLQDIDPAIDDRAAIDEIMFSKGEYLGGMASVIQALVERDAVTDSIDTPSND